MEFFAVTDEFIIQVSVVSIELEVEGGRVEDGGFLEVQFVDAGGEESFGHEGGYFVDVFVEFTFG